MLGCDVDGEGAGRMVGSGCVCLQALPSLCLWSPLPSTSVRPWVPGGGALADLWLLVILRAPWWPLLSAGPRGLFLPQTRCPADSPVP